MLKKFMPDLMVERFDDITPELLSSLGISALLVDIDNTLAPYEEPLPNPRVIAWVGLMREAGVRIALVSNNDASRVELFNRDLGLPAYPDCGKPSLKKLRLALSEMSAHPAEAAGVGDQCFTDAWAAHRLGARAIIMPPIRDKRTLFFRFKRLLERPIIAAYKRRNGEEK